MKRELCAGKLPHRKNPCLYVQEGGSLRVLAYFKGDAEFVEFMAFEPQYTQFKDEE
jgi:hypothetical protein